MYETRGYPIDLELRRAYRAARRRSRFLAALRTLAAAALRSGRSRQDDARHAHTSFGDK
jgi:hypothetical protein